MTREEAINEIKSWAIPSEKGREVLETLIPELRESKDERIRKAIIHYILYETKGAISEATEHTWVKWLEKQKERKPAEWNPNNEDVVLFNKAVTTNTNLTPSERAKLDIIRMKFKHCNGHIATNDFDLALGEGYIQGYNDGYNDAFGKSKPAEWSEEDEKMLRTIISDGSRGVELDSKQISWLKSLRPQPKQEWSVEDKLMVKCCLKALEYYKYTGKRGQFMPARFDIGGYLASVEKVENWLKSIRPVSKESLQSWKPSEEQMKALEDAFRKDGSDEYRKTINSLYQQLKRL